ncbi:acyl-CoA thioesterase [Prochlorococcus marinus]|uniref:acyl-CoA thioesterase n=1 Tax=Prochlorococcus marinus TaxID=1219 RepID=UPI0022B5D4F8|nr:acyl-CoA thioesterase [Prochlorococcus marinus]
MDEKNEIKPWVLQKVVLPQHTDHAGVMWHGSYLMWLEEARVQALSKVGLSYGDLSLQGYEMPVVDLRVKYISPLLHGDNVLLKSWIYQGKGPRWRWETHLSKDSEKSAAIAVVDLVILRRDNSGDHLLRKGPNHISKALIALQAGSTF